MKNAVIYHCRGGSPDDFWYPWLKKELEQRDYQVTVPKFPDSEPSPLSTWLPFALKASEYNNETVLIGHSSGAVLILSVLENLQSPIKQAILVAGFTEPLKEHDYDADPILQKSYDWEKIKANVGEIIFINSDNDPWGCDEKAGRKMLDQLGGTLIIPHGQGHMGSVSFNQPYQEFPLLVKLIA